MRSGNRIHFIKSFSFRLTLFYALLFIVSSLLLFTLVYTALRRDLLLQTDRLLLATAQKFTDLSSRRKLRIVEADFKRDVRYHSTENMFLRIVSPDGTEELATDSDWWSGANDFRVLPSGLLPDTPRFTTQPATPKSPAVRSVYLMKPDGQVFQVSRSMKQMEQVLETCRQFFGVALMINLLMGTGIGFLMIRKAMRRVDEVRNLALRISNGGDLDRRIVRAGNDDELDRLAFAFNTMLDKIHSLFNQLKQVSDNVAHDLRSPITRIRGAAESVLVGNGTIDEYREMSAAVIEESDRLKHIIDTMLEIASVEAGARPLAITIIDTASLLETTKEMFEPVAEDKKLQLLLSMPANLPVLHGDRACLQRLLSNLVDNAIKFTPVGGKVHISAELAGAEICVSIIDTGIGIEPEEQPKVFNRFFRSDKSRSGPGTGLGLSLAMAFAKAHGGTITVSSLSGKGTTFTLHLPLKLPAARTASAT